MYNGTTFKLTAAAEYLFNPTTKEKDQKEGVQATHSKIYFVFILYSTIFTRNMLFEDRGKVFLIWS